MPQTNDDLEAGYGPSIETSPNRVLDDVTTVRGGGVIDGANSRDATQSNPVYLGAGMPLGRLTSGGRYAPSVIGLGEAYTSGGTTLTTTPAAAAELVRRIGLTGTFNLKGIVSGAVASNQVTYSAVNTTTGAITITNIGVTYAADSWIQPEDGSETVVTIYNGSNEGFPQRMTREVDGTDVNTRLPVAIAALVIEANVTFWPAAGVFRTALRTELNSFGNFQFQEQYVG